MSTKTVKVQFVRDFRSAATDERAFAAGSVGEFPEPAALQIVSEGAAKVAPIGAKVTGPDPLADYSGGQLQAMADQAQRTAARNRQVRAWKQWLER